MKNIVTDLVGTNVHIIDSDEKGKIRGVTFYGGHGGWIFLVEKKDGTIENYEINDIKLIGYTS